MIANKASYSSFLLDTGLARAEIRFLPERFCLDVSCVRMNRASRPTVDTGKASSAPCSPPLGLSLSLSLARSLSLSQSLVPKYFQYIQLVEQTATKVKNANAIKNWALDAVSIGLDLLGLLEPIGIVFDLINVGLAFLRGLWMDGYVAGAVYIHVASTIVV